MKFVGFPAYVCDILLIMIEKYVKVFIYLQSVRLEYRNSVSLNERTLKTICIFGTSVLRLFVQVGQQVCGILHIAFTLHTTFTMKGLFLSALN